MRKFIIKALEKVYVVQHKRTSFSNRKRLNPYNPLTYVWLTIAIPLMFLGGAIVWFCEEWENPFKWR